MTAPPSPQERPPELWCIETGLSFLTGVELAPEVLQRDGASQLAALLTERAGGVPLVVADTPPLVGRRYFSVSDVDHGTAVLSDAALHVDPAWLVSRLEPNRDHDGWRIMSATMSLHDYGVGSLVLRWQAGGEARREQDYVRLVDHLNDEAGLRAAGSVHEVVAALASATTGSVLRLPEITGADLADDADPSTGSVLWVWNHCLLTAATGTQPEVAARTAEFLCPNGARLLDHRDHSYAAGVYTSVTCSRSGAGPDAVAMSRALARQDAWWTLYWWLDRRLLAYQFSLDRTITSGMTVRKLEARVTALSSVAERIRLYRSRVDSMLASSGARELEAWQLVSDAWALDFRMSVVDRKLGQLDQALRAGVDDVVRVRAARISLRPPEVADADAL